MYFLAMATKATKQATHVPVPRRWASLHDGADYMGVTVRTIRRWISDGRIPGHRMNERVIRVDLNELDAAMQPFGGNAA